MNRLHDETVKGRVVLYESNVKFVDIRIRRVLVSAREPEGGGWAPGDGTYKYDDTGFMPNGERNSMFKTYIVYR